MIAAVVLGGTSLKGGKGTLIGTFSAVLLVSVLNDMLVSRGVDRPTSASSSGCVLIVALTIDGLRTRSPRPAPCGGRSPPSGRANTRAAPAAR